MNNKSKKEFSKIFAIVILVLSCLITIFSCYVMYITRDISSLPVLISTIFAELATATGFYYSKAKAENKIKLKNELINKTLELQSKYSQADIDKAEMMINEAESSLNDSDDEA